MVGYRAGGLYWHPRTIEDSRGIPLDPPVVDESVLAAVDDLMEAVWYPDHRQRLVEVMDEVMENLTDAQGNGVLATLHRYIWCYAMLQSGGESPSSVDLHTLGDLGYPKFNEVVDAPKDLLVDLLALTFVGDTERTRELTIGQRIMLTAIAASTLETAFGEAAAEQVRESVTSLDWCPVENGVQAAVEPTMRTGWIDHCANGQRRAAGAP